MAQTIPSLPLSMTVGRDRLTHIGQARQALLYGAQGGYGTRSDRLADGLHSPLESWIAQSWQRCLAQGRRPDEEPVYAVLTPGNLSDTLDANAQLLQAAHPVLERLAHAIAGTRYFALLTNREGIVIDAHGPIDLQDQRAALISRLGTDLSEPQVGTTAVGSALAAQAPVWLHRGEHFFEASSVYSCAGAPLYGPDGECIGLLDVTGIETAERPELRHLVAQCARSITHALLQALPHALMLRLNWPGCALGGGRQLPGEHGSEGDGDGIVCLDANGAIVGANRAARELLPRLAGPRSEPLHCTDLFALPFGQLVDTARRAGALAPVLIDLPLWSGLHLQAMPLLPGQRGGRLPGLAAITPAPSTRPLRDLETALIRKAVDDARGNVLQAAKALGVSRATVYRRLSPASRRSAAGSEPSPDLPR